MARRSKESPIPTWFDLQSYVYLADLDSAGWLKLLVQLRMLFECASMDRGEFGAEDPEDIEDYLANLFIAFQQGSDRDGLDWHRDRYTDDAQSYGFGSVQSLSVGVVARMGATAELIEGGKEISGIYRRVVRAENRGDYAAWRKCDKELEQYEDQMSVPYFVALRDSTLKRESGSALTSNRAVAIDLNVPDDAIISDLKRWLAEMRKLEHHRAAKRSFGQQDFSKWISHGYVPLLVLDVWKKMTGVRLTYGDMCDAAFPIERGAQVDDVRKTFLPGARSWASQETIHALAAQAARERPAGQPEENGIEDFPEKNQA